MRKGQVLTVDNDRFTADKRFKVIDTKEGLFDRLPK